MNRYRVFLEEVKSRYSDNSYKRILQALRMTVDQTKELTRYNDQPFVYHALGVAEIVMTEIGLGSNSVIAALLHDVVRLERVNPDLLQEQFGVECVEILQGLSNISSVETKASKEQLEHFKELIVSYSTNPRIILIKMADRLEVMRELGSFPADKRAKKSWESMYLYAQLAHKLGLYGVKTELEDLSLGYLYPEEYAHIKEQLARSATERVNFIERFIRPISDRLTAEGLNYSVKGRTKSIYSIWRKMKKQSVGFEEVYDVFAIRVVLDCVQEQEKSQCWHVYSVVTDFYKPNPDRMRDWISIPKSNGYESLHTTVVTDDGKWVEVQIRSRRMDEVAERGIAAHWRYKGVSGNTNNDNWLQRLRELMEGVDLEHSAAPGNQTPLGSNKEIFIFTPNGDLRKLPEGATVLDFAFDIHSNLGCVCVGGKVNHRNVPIKEVLKNGDLVEILTVKNQKPKPDWLNIVKTSKAKSKIKAFLREEESKMANLGREELERKIRNWKLTVGLEEAVNVLYKYYKAKSGLELYGMLAQEKVTMLEVKEVLTRYISGEDVLRVREERVERKERKNTQSSDCLIIDSQLRGVDYKLAKCCNPIYGDEIFGFVSIMNGLTIHRHDCANGARLRERYPYRIINAAWSGNTSGGAFSAKIGFVSEDVIGLEHGIRDVLKELGVTMRGVSVDYGNNSVSGVISLEVSSTGILDSVSYRLMKIKGMQKTFRIGGKTV